MSLAVCDLGDTRRIDVLFEDVDETPLDPIVVTLKSRNPEGDIVDYTYGGSPNVIQKASTGVYYADIEMDVVGEWYFQWGASGTVMGVESTLVNVFGSGF